MSRAARPTTRARSRGFTLIEIVVAMTLSAIVMGFIVLLMVTPVQSYFAQTRRAELVDTASRVSQHMSRDLRTAIPSSVRQRPNGNFRLIEMIVWQPTIDGAVPRYRPRTGANPDTNATLNIGQLDSTFSIFGQFLPSGSPATVLSSRRLLVGAAGSNPYTSANFLTPAMDITVTSLANDEETIALPAAFRFLNASPGQRMFMVAGTVAYLCDLTQRTLRRYDGFAIAANATAHDTPAELAAVSATNTLIANDVTACTFRPIDPTATTRGLVSLQVTLTRNGEVLRVVDQVPLEIGP